MAELSEEQLLLLNNLMYFKGPDNAMSVKELALAAMNAKPSSLSGGFEGDPSRMKEIAKTILKDPQLSNLHVAGSLDKHNVYAKCFVDDNGDATIAIRGTGGSYEAWKDNFVGGYDNDTVCQETLRDFVQDMGHKYDDITITGHSKGGNLAQYATVKEGDTIDRCVSFDGQGFSKDFIDENKKDIEDNYDKIKCINAHNDFVSILLTPIAGTIVYLDNKGTGADGHSSYYLWQTNRGKMNENGEYDHHVKQDPTFKTIQDMLLDLTDKLDGVPDIVAKEIFDTVGAFVGVLFGIKTKQIGFKDLIDIVDTRIKNMFSRLDPRNWKIRKHKGKFKHKKIKRYSSKTNNKHISISVKMSKLSHSAHTISNASKALKGIASDIDGIRYRDIDKINNAIKSSHERIEQISVTLKKMADVLNKSAELYRKTESEIAE